MLTRFICLACIVTQLAACSTMRPVAPSASDLQAGDRVRVVMHSGREMGFHVSTSSANSICGAQECVARADIATFEREEFDALKTLGLTALILVLVFGTAAAASGPMVSWAPAAGI